MPPGLELGVLLCLRAKGRPDGYHQMGIVVMYLVDHFLGIGIVLGIEFHRVPEIVVAPVLPVLDHAVDRDAGLAVAVQDVQHLGGTLVSLAALHEAIAPERHHRHFSGKFADTGNHSVGIASIYKIIVNALANLGLETHPVSRILEVSRRRIVPEYSISLD